MFLEDHKAPRNLPVHLNNTIQDFKMALCTKKMHVSIDNVCHLEKVKCNCDSKEEVEIMFFRSIATFTFWHLQ